MNCLNCDYEFPRWQIDVTRCPSCGITFGGELTDEQRRAVKLGSETPEGSDTLPNTVPSLMNNRKTLGIVISIIGVALIVISPSLLFIESGKPSVLDPAGLLNQQITDLRDAAKFCGVALLIVGGIISAVGFSQSTSTQPTPPPTPTTQPVVTQSISPKSIELGNTPDEVQLVMGKPDKIINLGARVIHVYKDMKIIYVDGKVSDVQLS